MGNILLKKSRGKVDDPEKITAKVCDNPVNRVLSINEIVSKILTHVFNINQTELMKCRLVCKNWKSNVFVVLVKNQVQFRCATGVNFKFTNKIRKHFSPTCELPLVISGVGLWPNQRLLKLLDIYANSVSALSIIIFKDPRKLLHPKQKHPVLPNLQTIELTLWLRKKKYSVYAGYLFSLVTILLDGAEDLKSFRLRIPDTWVFNGIPSFVTNVQLRLDAPDQLQQALSLDDIPNIKGLHTPPDPNTYDFRVVFNCPEIAECLNTFLRKRTVSPSILEVSCRVGVLLERIFRCRNVFLNMKNMYITDSLKCKTVHCNLHILQIENIRPAELRTMLQTGIFVNVEKLDVKLVRYDEDDNISEQNLVRKLLAGFPKLKTLSYKNFKHCPLLGLLNLFTQMHNLQLLDIEVDKECLESLQSDGLNLGEFGRPCTFTKLEVIKIRNLSTSALPVCFPERIYNDLFTKMSKLRSVVFTGQIVVKKED